MMQTILSRYARAIAVLSALAVGLSGNALAQDVPKSDSKVKVSHKAEKPDADGNQTVVVTLEIEKGWHLYANPVENEEFVISQTKCTFKAGDKALEAKVNYPEGKLIKDKSVGDYRVYEGTVEIKAVVPRGKDTTPVKLNIRVQACDSGKCLVPATIPIEIP